jgi:Helix-turn-helix domain
MRITSPFAVTLSVIEYESLTRLTRQVTAPARAVLRARIVLAAARRETNASIARGLGVSVDTVRKWRRRFAAERLAGLHDRGSVWPPAGVQRRAGRAGRGVGLRTARPA